MRRHTIREHFSVGINYLPYVTPTQGRHWARAVQVGQSRDLARLAVWYIATRLGRGVAMSFVLVMFTLQFSHVEPDLTFISVTFPYFMLTNHRWSGQLSPVGHNKPLV